MSDLINTRMIEDLESSGLTPQDIRARVLSNPERAATSLEYSIQGYVIPYFDLNSHPVPFYRVKAFDHMPKYKQVKATANHIYFPQGVKQLILNQKYVIITEGEKKAASATKHGFPCIALSGVDSWRNRTLVLPADTKLTHIRGREELSVKLSADEGIDAYIDESNLAVGFQHLIDLCVEHDIIIIICFDSDESNGSTKFEVQRAAATLGFEMRFKGLPLQQIKQMFLPSEGKSNGSDSHKMGLDDFLRIKFKDELERLIQKTLKSPDAFPKHPNIQEFVGKRLQRSKASRKECQHTALAIIADLDARGSRLLNKDTDEMYFFEKKSRILMSASLRQASTDIIQNSAFARYLFRTYGIGSSDKNVMQWLATFFTTEFPIGNVSPQRVCCVRGDIIYQQLNDGQYLKVQPNPEFPFEIKNNGDDGILFESGVTNPLDANEVLDHCHKQMQLPSKPWWHEVLKETRLKHKDENEYMLSLLFYLSPWLQRWRGMQLPIEMAIGEAGSGKSSLYELRLGILIGDPALRNAPDTLKDWHASISATGGIHVTDNLHMLDKQLRQRMSDELCRLCTEPNPRIEMRKLYSDNLLIKMPINTTFAVTAVQQPFHNGDLMQRSIIIEFDKGSKETNYESQWASARINRYGGRAAWIAHHMVTLHRFLKLTGRDWDSRYRAKHRLINLEQALMKMAVVFGIDPTWIPDYLTKSTELYVQSADWAFEGLCEFARLTYEQHGNKVKFGAQEISSWAKGEPEFEQCHQLTNSRMLGKYMASHKQALGVIAGFKWVGKYANRDTYCVEPMKPNLRAAPHPEAHH